MTSVAKIVDESSGPVVATELEGTYKVLEQLNGRQPCRLRTSDSSWLMPGTPSWPLLLPRKKRPAPVEMTSTTEMPHPCSSWAGLWARFSEGP